MSAPEEGAVCSVRPSQQPEPTVINVTLLEPRMKHPAIFKQFDAMQPGAAFRILNDHDPKPLYYQMLAERGPVFTWQYLQNGPQWWEVEIKKHEAGETIGEIAARDLKKASVFKRFGIDFCCGGKKTLKQACAEMNLDEKLVEEALQAADAGRETTNAAFDFHRWQPDFLADYIYNQHHIYYYEEGPVIAELVYKVSAKHGSQYPQLEEVKKLYSRLQEELKTHFLKEERVLFPFIKAMTKAKANGDFSELHVLSSVQEPVHMMEMEHDAAGELLRELRKATNDFTPPQGACNSFGLLYHKLAELEEDLHQHIHLENNILFVKALELERALKK